MKTLSFLNHHWNEIIFEHRNKAYGAYYIRESYDARVIRALAFAFLSIAALVTAPLVVDHYFSKTIEEIHEKIIVFEPRKVEQPTNQPKQAEMKKPANKAPQKTSSVLTARDAPSDTTAEVVPVETMPARKGEVADAGAGKKDDDSPTLPSTGGLPNVLPPLSPWQLDKAPEFPGGTEAFYAFLRNNIRYPSSSRDMEGTVYISFVINQEGVVTNVKLLRGMSAECDNEVIRVVNKMPKWKAGMAHNEAVSSLMQLPVKFTLIK